MACDLWHVYLFDSDAVFDYKCDTSIAGFMMHVLWVFCSAFLLSLQIITGHSKENHWTGLKFIYKKKNEALRFVKSRNISFGLRLRNSLQNCLQISIASFYILRKLHPYGPTDIV